MTGKIGLRIGVRHAAADGAPVAHLHVADAFGGLGESGQRASRTSSELPHVRVQGHARR